MDLPKAIRDLFSRKEENKPQAEQSAPIVNETEVQPEKKDLKSYEAIFTGYFPMKEKKEAAAELAGSDSSYDWSAQIFIQSDEERLSKIAKEGLGTWQVDNKVEAFFWIYPDNELLKDVKDPFYAKYGLDKYIPALEKCARNEPDPCMYPFNPHLYGEELEKAREEYAAFEEKLKEEYADYNQKIATAEKIQQEVKEVAAAALAKLKQQKEQSFGADDLLVLDGQLRQIGLSLETLRQKDDNSVNNLIKGRRTALFPIRPAIAGVEFQTEARLSMSKNEAGQPQLFLHPVKRLLSEELERPFHGHTFTNEQKRQLMAFGNAGEVISITGAQGTPEKVLVSVDRQVNDLVAVPVERVQRQIPNTFQNQPLNQEQKDLLLAGRPVSLDNIQSKDGNVFSGKIQYNAEKQKVELLPDGLNVTQIRNVVLQEREQQLLREGKTILVPGLIDGKGEQYSGWIRLDMKSRQIAVTKDVPGQRIDTKKEITPGNDFKVQVNQNSKGLKTEENKHAVEPLRHGQTRDENNKKGMKL